MRYNLALDIENALDSSRAKDRLYKGFRAKARGRHRRKVTFGTKLRPVIDAYDVRLQVRKINVASVVTTTPREYFSATLILSLRNSQLFNYEGQSLINPFSIRIPLTKALIYDIYLVYGMVVYILKEGR